MAWVPNQPVISQYLPVWPLSTAPMNQLFGYQRPTSIDDPLSIQKVQEGQITATYVLVLWCRLYPEKNFSLYDHTLLLHVIVYVVVLICRHCQEYFGAHQSMNYSEILSAQLVNLDQSLLSTRTTWHFGYHVTLDLIHWKELTVDLFLALVLQQLFSMTHFMDKR